MKKDEIKEYLKLDHLGRGKAISGEQLRKLFSISKSELHRLVNRLRREGVPIASDHTGYFYAETAGDVYATIRILCKLRAALDAAIAGLEQTLHSFASERG